MPISRVKMLPHFHLLLRLSTPALRPITDCCFFKKSIWLHYWPSLAPQCLPLSNRIQVLKWSWPSTTNPPKLSSRLQAQNTTSSNPTSSDPAWPSGSLLLSWDVLLTLPSQRMSTRNYCENLPCHVPELSHLWSKEELEFPLQLPLAWVNSGFRL